MLKRYIFETYLRKMELSDSLIESVLSVHDDSFGEVDAEASPEYVEKDWDTAITYNDDDSTSVEMI